MLKILGVLPVLCLSMVAQANHYPDPGNMYEVKRLAQQLESQSQLALSQAQAYGGYYDSYELSAINALRQATDSALRFRLDVTSYYQNPAQTEYSFELLTSDFNRADLTYTNLRAYRDNRGLFDAIRNTLSSLRYYYRYDAPPYYPPSPPPYYPPSQPPYYPPSPPPYYPPSQPPYYPSPRPPYYPSPRPPYYPSPRPPHYPSPRPQPHPPAVPRPPGGPRR